MSAQKLVLLSAAVILTACATAQENPHYQHSTKYQGPAQSSAPSTAYASNAPVGSSNTRQVVYEQAAAATNTNYGTASYGTTTYTAPAYSRVDAACVEQGLQNTANCQPNSVAINGQSASIATPYVGAPQTLYVTSSTTVQTPQSPTEQAMPDSYGTPGYEAMKNAETEWRYEAQETPVWEVVDNTPPSAAAAPGVSVPMTQPFASPLPSPEMRAPKIQDARSPMITPQAEQSFAIGTQHEIVEGDTVYSFARGLCSSVDEIKAMNSLDGTFNIRLGDTIRLPASKCE